MQFTVIQKENYMWHYITPLFEFFSFDSMRDLSECIMFITLIYGLLSWLARESTKILIVWCYAWLLGMLIAHSLCFDTLLFCMLISTPFALIAAIVMHEDKLQKNFVMHRTASVAQNSIDWIAHLMRALITATNKEKTVLCVIEQKDSLQTYIQSTKPLQAPIAFGTLDMLIQTESQPLSTVLISASNKNIIGSSLVFHYGQTNIQPQSKEFIDHVLLALGNSDGCMIVNDPATRTYTVYTKNNQVICASPEHALRLLYKLSDQHAEEKKNYDIQTPSCMYPPYQP